MGKMEYVDGQLQVIIPLQVKPFAHQAVPTITGSPVTDQAGTVLYGYYSMDYHLPGGDCLRIIANHNKEKVQLFVLTSDAEKLQQLPGERPASLVANTISHVNRYRIRANSYEKPLADTQAAKYELASQCIASLQQLLFRERNIAPDNWAAQEALRGDVLVILRKCCAGNRLLANSPTTSKGELNRILFDTVQMAQHYEFNRIYQVTRIDQLDFTHHDHDTPTSQPSCFVWDSELRIGQDEDALNDAIRVICQLYGLNSAPALTIAANRFKRLALFLRQLWHDSRDWADHLTTPHQSTQISNTEHKINGLSITRVKPYYHLSGLEQLGYKELDDLVAAFAKTRITRLKASSLQQAMTLLASCANGYWAEIPNQQLVIRVNNKVAVVNYFVDSEALYHPLPCGEDLFTLSQLSKRPLYLPERVKLRVKAFFSRLPAFFIQLYNHLYQLIAHELSDEFIHHVHSGHNLAQSAPKIPPPYLISLQHFLSSEGMLANGQTLEDFVQAQITANRYVLVREHHPPSPPTYNNPLHRMLGVLRHTAGFFIEANEKNPIIGTLAMAAYAYGAGAIIAPEVLTNLLNKLHMSRLISSIKFTQEFGKWISHGTTSEAISTAVAYWQCIVVGGDLDQFFVKAATVLKEDPAEVAIIVALAMSLGYGLCKAVPTLQEEMGYFPYINYAALGAKGGAALYSTIMHPGEDWFLGSIKWLLTGGLTLVKIVVGPLVESYHYGYRQGLLFGFSKSLSLMLYTKKQTLAALSDLLLALATIPLLEMGSLFIHIPFQGLTGLLSKSLAILGNWHALGQALIDFADWSTNYNDLPGFRLSPFYGLNLSFKSYTQSFWLNVCLNLLKILILAPVVFLKNVILLPIIDISSFSIRFSLTCLNPISRQLAYTLGTLLIMSAVIWDNTVGHIFRLAANGVTHSSNWIEGLAGQAKQSLLARLQILRCQLHQWAFSQEDFLLHKISTEKHRDKNYFLANPMHLEKLEPLPHDSTRCLLEILLATKQLPAIKSPISANDDFLFNAANQIPLSDNEETKDTNKAKEARCLITCENGLRI
jgi:hypothetical protein